MRARLFGLMFLRGAVYGAAGPFVPLLLLRAELPLALLGPVSGLAAVITLLAAPVWGRLGDTQGRRRMLVFAMAAGAPVLALFALDTPVLLVVAYLAWAVMSAAYAPLGDSLTLDRLGGGRGAFAKLRTGATSGYIVAVLVAGALIVASPLGYDGPAALGVALALGTALVIAARLGSELRTGRGLAHVEAPDATEAAFAGAEPGVPGGVGVGVETPDSPATTMGRIRTHLLFLTGLVGIFAAINSPAIFMGPRLLELRGTAFDFSLSTASGALFEIPAFLLVPFMLARAGSRRTFLAGGLLLGASGLLAALAPTPALVIVARLASGIGYAWVIIPSLAALAASGGPTERASLNALHYSSGAAASVVVALAAVPLVALAGESTAPILALAALMAPGGTLLALRHWPAPSGR